jgi:hypothetical protein
VFVNSSWFKEAINSYPELSESLIVYQEKQDWQLPLPDGEKTSAFPNWLIYVLVTLWLGLSIQFRYLPYVRPMMIRYFLAHRFFVDDILHYRERAALGGILLMHSHAIFGGMVAFMTAKTIISAAGLEAFFFHFPVLAVTGLNYASFFFIGFILVLLTQGVALLWLHLPAKNIEHVSQTINLYAGSLFIDFILVTIMLTLYTSGFGAATITSFAILFVLIWFGAFNFAAYDISSGNAPGRVAYLALTLGLHTVISAGLLILFLNSTHLIQILSLSIGL